MTNWNTNLEVSQFLGDLVIEKAYFVVKTKSGAYKVATFEPFNNNFADSKGVVVKDVIKWCLIED